MRRKKGGSRSLEVELRDVGYRGDIRDFRDTLLDLKIGLYRSWSDEMLVLHPREAMRYCDIVRYRFGLDGLPDHLILRILFAIRKSDWGGLTLDVA